jgi:hypothetical protein
LWQEGLGDLDLSADSGTLEINTDSGQIELLNSRIVFPAGMPGFRGVDQAHAVRAGVFSFRRVVIPAAITVRPTSSSTSALVIAASQVITIEGTIDWQGRGALGGARTSNGSPAHPDVGGAGKGAMADGNGSGGGGGGYAFDGTSGDGGSSGQGGNSYGMPTIVPLQVGAGGGGGGGVEPGGLGGTGGTGGGAVALLTLGTLTVRGTLGVAGNDGRPGGGMTPTAPAGGGGGGAGGSLVLSASSLVLDTNHALVALGGKGGLLKANGGNGGTGSVGRIWLGYDTINVTGSTANSMPTEVRAPGGKVNAFPR